MITKLISIPMLAMLATGAMAVGTGSAQGAITFNIALDDGSRTTMYIFPTVTTTVTDLGPVYAASGAPTVTTVFNSTTFNFNSVLSNNFDSQITNSAITVGQSTDGHLVLNLHFPTPVSVTAAIYEGGTWSTTGDGTVAVNGGELLIEAVNPTPVESHARALNAIFDKSGGWTSTATTDPFNGIFTDYQLLVDNILNVSATNGTADIEKKVFDITIAVSGSGAPPVPEPASLGILGLGATALLARRRR